MAQTRAVDVWLVSLIGDPVATPESAQGNGDEAILSPDELLRAARFRFDSDRARWIRSRGALRCVLADQTGIPAEQIRFVVGPYGKPALADNAAVEFSLSHAGDWAMIAVARGVPVGIDIERIRENVDIAALLGRLGETSLPDSRTALYSVWTRREAMTKALGGALLEKPRGDLRTCHLEAPEGYRASLALVGYDPEVRCHIPAKSIPRAPEGPFAASTKTFCN